MKKEGKEKGTLREKGRKGEGGRKRKREREGKGKGKGTEREESIFGWILVSVFFFSEFWIDIQ